MNGTSTNCNQIGTTTTPIYPWTLSTCGEGPEVCYAHRNYPENCSVTIRKRMEEAQKQQMIILNGVL